MTQQERHANKEARRAANTFSQFDDTFNEIEVKQYHDYQDNRAQAQALLAKLKAKEAEGMGCTKVFWKDAQPTLVQCSSKMYWEAQLKKRGFDGRPENVGLPATDSHPRVAAGWEAKLDRRRRAAYTLAQTQTMTFKSSGHLPAEYYQEEEQLEAYINSLEKEKKQ